MGIGGFILERMVSMRREAGQPFFRGGGRKKSGGRAKVSPVGADKKIEGERCEVWVAMSPLIPAESVFSAGRSHPRAIESHDHGVSRIGAKGYRAVQAVAGRDAEDGLSGRLERRPLSGAGSHGGGLTERVAKGAISRAGYVASPKAPRESDSMIGSLLDVTG